MKKLTLILSFTTAVISAVAQQPSPDLDTVKNPVKQIDPEPKQEPADIHYIDEQVRITADELPRVVLDSLKQREPAAWEKSVVYKDKQSNTFTVQVREGGQERTYRFDKNGAILKNPDYQDNKKRQGGKHSTHGQRKQ